MKPLLRALIVEDSESDTRLLLGDLERSDYEILHERVETAEALTAALDLQKWDILFCDFTMPKFSGLEALKIVKERDLDLPFIFVSGTLGEDAAVQAMKVGAHDYVLKGNLARLIPAMERELREADVRLQRRNAEQDMRISEYKYRQLFESLGDAAFLIDCETGRIIDTNPQAEVLLGRSRTKILGTRENQLFWPRTERAGIPALLSVGDGALRFESSILQTDGGIVPVDVSVSRLELYDRPLLLALFHDLTEKNQMEVQFLRAQRIELIGTLAAGIAHDLNNILQVIITNLDLANAALPSDTRLPKYLEDASTGADRATGLARRLLNFSKHGDTTRRSLDVAEILTPAVLLALGGSKLKPFFAFQQGLSSVIGDPLQLTQVIENVVLNACEAAPPRGRLLVRADNIEVALHASSDLPAGRYVRIEIEDTGTGIPAEIRDKIFEVCFTTKPGGSGLGLATVKSIMHQHHGSVAIESLVGHGTTVSLFLPATSQRPDLLPAPLPVPTVKTTGRILVIDDDEMILRVVSSMLNALGYECAVAKDGVEGCNEYVQAKADQRPFAAVMLDATIPNGLSGEEALKLLLEADRDARVILCTGYTESDLFKEARQLGFKAILAKPFSMPQFISVVNKVLS